MKFRKKPVVIEAIQLQRDNLKLVEIFMAGCVLPELYPPGQDWGINWGNSTVIIHTLEGDMHALPGDWIIRGVKGELYPCKPDIFEATYEPAEHKEQHELSHHYEGADYQAEDRVDLF